MNFDGQLITTPPTRRWPNNGKFPKGWIKEKALKKYLLPYWKIHGIVAYPPGHSWVSRPSPLGALTSDVLYEVNLNNQKLLIPHGFFNS